MKQLLSRLIVEDAGQDLIEYAMVAALIGLGIYGAARNVTNGINKSFNTVASSLTSAV